MGDPKRWLGLDIGGANLKAATASGYARSAPFALWKEPGRLAAAIGGLLADAPPHDALAVTMTGELADCFASKAEGVAAIVAAVSDTSDGAAVWCYSLGGGGRFLPPEDAIVHWPLVAAANWHALAAAVALEWAAGGLLIDIGSTTTDVIPFDRSGATTNSTTDTERLLSGELVYAGVGRTPLCAVVDALPYRGAECPVAAEFFATTGDVMLLLGHASEGDDRPTADDRPFTVEAATARLARMVCADEASFNRKDAVAAAEAAWGSLVNTIAHAVRRVVGAAGQPAGRVVVAGEGERLAMAVLDRLGWGDQADRLADRIGERASGCACAWAVARLAEERDGS
ncbi:MAG: hydantoinase/oxoprolinase family protein [Planctomycetota bacterium]